MLNFFLIFSSGSILIDEMKLSEGISFDSSSKKVVGLVHLGKHTPQAKEKDVADHALVLMFQPFRGPWIQTIAAFCTKGAATGEELEIFLVEAIGLLEKAGFKVDAVVSDAGPWNRVMWKLFGVSLTKTSCVHPVDMDQKRRLYFFSDFPHLMKSVWSRIGNSLVIQV